MSAASRRWCGSLEPLMDDGLRCVLERHVLEHPTRVLEALLAALERIDFLGVLHLACCLILMRGL